MFTSHSLLPTCLEVDRAMPIETYLFDMPNEIPDPSDSKQRLAQIMKEGSVLDDLEDVELGPAQGREQVAYLCPTSGTSGKQVCDL